MGARKQPSALLFTSGKAVPVTVQYGNLRPIFQWTLGMHLQGECREDFNIRVYRQAPIPMA